MASKNAPASKNVPAVAAPPVPVAAPPALTMPAVSGRGKLGGAPPLTADGVTMTGLALPQHGGESVINYMMRVMLANPDKFVSKSQLAAATGKANIPSARSGFTGARHTASCQTGKQGTSEHGFIFTTGKASDGEVGFMIDTQASEKNIVSQIKPQGDEQTKPVTRAARQGVLWVVRTPEGKAAGLRGLPG